MPTFNDWPHAQSFNIPLIDDKLRSLRDNHIFDVFRSFRHKNAPLKRTDESKVVFNSSAREDFKPPFLFSLIKICLGNWDHTCYFTETN